MLYVGCKICPDSMFQKWQLWTKLHKFKKTAQLAPLGGQSSQRVLARASSIKHNMRQFRDKTGNCNSQHKVWRTERWTGEEPRTKEAEGWLAWPRNTLCASVYRVSRVSRVSRVTCDEAGGCQMCQSPPSLTVRWEEGGIFRLLKVHLLHSQQVLVSNEGNDECFCGDELAGAGRGGSYNSQKSSRARPQQLKLSPGTFK